MNLFNITFIFFIVALMPLSATAHTANDDLEEKINQILVSNHFQGAAYITRDGLPMLNKGYGLANMQWHIPNTKDTKFRIASLSKTFTEVIIMMLAQEKRLNIDETLNTYLPDFPGEYASQITIRHLLRHRTGIPRLFNIEGWANGTSLTPLTQDEFLSKIADMPLAFEVDSARQYSSANYYLLGAVIEKVVGQPFGSVLHNKILQPLKLKNTDVYRSGQLVSRLANAYKPVAGKYSFCPKVEGEFCSGGNINLALFMAAGSMYSTTEDLIKWSQALEGNLLLNKQSKAFLFNTNTYATWDIQAIEFLDKKIRRVFVADGELEGNSSILIKSPDQRLSIVLLNNTGMSYREKANIGLKIANLFIE